MSEWEARFWAKVEKTDGCWLWTASQNGVGYGKFGLDGKFPQAHRLAYELLVGPIPDGLSLDHLCRVRHCVNPAHLEPVTHGENMARGMAPSAIAARTRICRNGHPLPAGEPGKRRCRVCNAAWQRARRQTLKAAAV